MRTLLFFLLLVPSLSFATSGVQFFTSSVAVVGSMAIPDNSGQYGLTVSSGISLAGLIYTNNGNVGIGTTSPATALDVNGVVTATSFAGTVSLSNSIGSVAIVRDLTSTAGDVAYTGCGFQPTALIAFAALDGTYTASWGFSIPNKASMSTSSPWESSANTYTLGSILIMFKTAASHYQSATVKSYDADGFTLTWSKGNDPTGTGRAYVMCIR